MGGNYALGCFQWAIEEGDKGFIEFLMAKAADVNAKNKHGKTPYTPLDIALREGNTEIAELLKKHGAK